MHKAEPTLLKVALLDLLVSDARNLQTKQGTLTFLSLVQ
jgi:hypothetical protein